MIEIDTSEYAKLRSVSLGASRVPTVTAPKTSSSSRAGRFRVEQENLNYIEGKKNDTGDTEETTASYIFPGNIAPEGYFYSPFYPVTLKELDDEIQSVVARRVNFDPSTASLSVVAVEVYDPDMGMSGTEDFPLITVTSPTDLGFMPGRPFSVYDVLEEKTYRAHLSAFTGNVITIAVKGGVEIDEVGLRGLTDGADGQSRYIISVLEDNAPEYAEFLPSSQKLVWRAPKKMSDLTSDSPIYNMPFTNGRLYIHKNINVFVRRQDPVNVYKLFRPNMLNPLKRFQVEGDKPLDFSDVRFIIDQMLESC